MATGRYPERGAPGYSEQPTARYPADDRYGYPEAGGPPPARRRNYQQGTYGRNEYGEPMNPFGAEADRRFGIAGVATGLIGAIMVLVALTGLNWFSGTTTGTLDFGQADDVAQQGLFSDFGQAYFGWLAWLFFIVVVLAVVLAAFPSPALRVFRAVGVVAGVAAAGLAFLAIQPSSGTPGYGDVLSDTSVGFWLAVAGFLLAAVGAGIGAQRV